MDELPADMKLAILQRTGRSPLRRLSFHVVRSSPVYYTPMHHEIRSDVFGVRQGEGFALCFSASLRRELGVVFSTEADEDAALRRRESTGYEFEFCFDVDKTRLCLFRSAVNYVAEPIGDVQMQLHCAKSPLAATCRAFRDLMNNVPGAPTDCVVPRKFIASLCTGDKGTDVDHTLVVVEAGDPDGVLRYYREKEENGDFEGSDAEEEFPAWGV